MSRSRKRACLEQGQKLDLAVLTWQGYVQPGQATGPCEIRWTDSISGDVIALGFISADLRNKTGAWFQITIGNLDQRIMLVACERHFGGHQWYFVCGATNYRASVLWKPIGASRFCCRKAWEGQVAYLSQFGNWIDRAHAGKAKVNARLLGDCDLDEWDLPPKPTGMWWRTYNMLVNRYDGYQNKLDAGIAALAPRSWREG
jgi:hypothetical protein